MVIVQDVFRHLLKPIEKRFRSWESAGGAKASFARFFRIGKVGPGTFETAGKLFNNVFMWAHFIAQRPWGPLYKRWFEFDMHPTKLTMLFYTHCWVYLGWIGHKFLEDIYDPDLVANDPNYLQYYMNKYHRQLEPNILNWRTSAHYIEIDRIYHHEMRVRYEKLRAEIKEEHERRKTLAINS